MEKWKAYSPEDKLLRKYWARLGGRMYVEVPIGGTSEWPSGSTRRRLDAVCVQVDQHDAGIFYFQTMQEDFRDRIQHRQVELIEAKTYLERGVIGQIIAGHDMFE